MQRITLDFETYWDKDQTLSKIFGMLFVLV